jgi:hypothetical protein
MTQVIHSLVSASIDGVIDSAAQASIAGSGTGAQIGSRLFHVILVFSENARNLPKLVDQLPSAAPSFNCKLHRFNMREKTRILCRQSRLNPPTRTQSLKMSTPEFQKMQASARATRSLR